MIPKNWSFVQLGSVAKSQYGYTAKAIDDKSLPKMLRITDIQNGKVDWENVPNCQIDGELLKKYLLQDGDIVIARTGATTGKSYLLNNPINSVFASYLIRLRSSKNLNVKYLYYFLQSNSYWNQISELAVGIAQPGVNSSKLQRINFPLPPLDEQQRIVDIIENLFAKLDKAKAFAQNIIDNYELRRSSILHRAFNGELTIIWRKNNNICFNSWKILKIGDFSFVTKLAGFEYTKYIFPSLSKIGIPLFKGKNVQDGNLMLKFESYIPEKISDNLYRSQLNRKCLLIPYVGTIGNIAIFDGTFKAHLGSNVGKIEINNLTFEEYLLYYLLSDFGYKELTKYKKATAQESISIQAIRDVYVKLPTIEEQKEIVRILDSLLAKEQRTKELAEQVLQKIDLMKKSILARAFRGELNGSE